MNIIYSDKRSCLTVQNVANLIIINLIGLPFSSWDLFRSRNGLEETALLMTTEKKKIGMTAFSSE